MGWQLKNLPNYCNIKVTVHSDYECQFHAEITAPGIIIVNFDKMPLGSQEVSTYFIIDGADQQDTGTTVVKVTRTV